MEIVVAVIEAGKAGGKSIGQLAGNQRREPLTRAEYLLDPEAAKESHGSEPARRRPEFDFPASPELLSDVMEARELISDAETPIAVLAALMMRTRKAVSACESDLSAAFRAGDELGARKIAAALSYYTKIVREVEPRLEDTR